MEYSEQELRIRSKCLGSTRSILDRRKFAQEFDVNTLKLSHAHREIWDANSHIRQVFANRRDFRESPLPVKYSDRIVLPQTPRISYQRRQGEAKTVEHWGQRKLLLSEIEFLSNYGGLGKVIVYAGAAPGNHTNYLAETLFPNKFKWVLVDPARFAAKETEDIKIINDFFDDGLAKRFSGRDDVLFICDIRSMDSSQDDKEKEHRVQVDMESQQRWHRIIKPQASMLKFRLPYANGFTEYLSGTIYFQPWAGRTSSETRLVITRGDNDKIKLYSHKDYEDLMFCFNTETRTTYFPHDVHCEGIDHCYDCASEIYILQNYLRKVKKVSNQTMLNEMAASLSKEITAHISTSGRKLSM